MSGAPSLQRRQAARFLPGPSAVLTQWHGEKDFKFHGFMERFAPGLKEQLPEQVNAHLLTVAGAVACAR
ncbi:hypothetical protein EJB05_17340, partial [Eragrostis curvula]